MSKKNLKKIQYNCESDIKDISLPQGFLREFEKDYGVENAKNYQKEFESNSVRGVRFTSFKSNPQNVIDCLDLKLETIPYFDNAYYLLSEEKLGNSLLHQSGAIYLQEPSSMVPVASVRNFDFNNKLVLDLCASPGGKTTQIATLMQGTGELISNEIDTKRSKTLFSNIERLGVKNCVVANETPQNLAKIFPNTFDYIFVDAPCSGEGMFRKDKQAILEWNENLKFYNKERQLEILSSAHQMLKAGGIMIYSTCTFNTIENESVVNDFTKKYDYTILPLDEKITCATAKGVALENNIELEKTAHFFPYTGKGEGQYVAVLKKNGELIYSTSRVKNAQPKPNEIKIVKDFFEKNLAKGAFENFDFMVNKEKICCLPKQNNLLELDRVNTLTKGVILGEIVKNRLEIHHQFFNAYGELFKNYVDLKINSDLLKKYVLGMELDLLEVQSSQDLLSQNNLSNGYGVIKVCGYNLGGYKFVDGKLKNHYPKGLRLNKN